MAVTFYTSQNCAFCDEERKFLKENYVFFREIDVTKNTEEFSRILRKANINKISQIGAPVIDIDGKIIIGFDKEALKKALDI